MPKLLLSKRAKYVVVDSNSDFHCKEGVISAKELKKARVGQRVSTHLGAQFSVAKPSLLDLFEKMRRVPQVMLPKDLALILAYTGARPGSLVVDAGTGSGFAAIFLAHYLKPCRVVTYEKELKFVEVAEHNVRLAGLQRYIQIKHEDIKKGIGEREVDLITLDMAGAEEVVEHAFNALRTGGWLVVYSPIVEQVIEVRKRIDKLEFCEVKTVEGLVREWQHEYYTRPKSIGLLHTGWLTFARKC